MLLVLWHFCSYYFNFVIFDCFRAIDIYTGYKIYLSLYLCVCICYNFDGFYSVCLGVSTTCEFGERCAEDGGNVGKTAWICIW